MGLSMLKADLALHCDDPAKLTLADSKKVGEPLLLANGDQHS